MTHHDRNHDQDAPHHESIEQATPFDEATDIIDEGDIPGDSDDLGRIERIALPPGKVLVVLVAIVLSPVFALPFGLNAALAVLVLAMAFTTWLAWDGASRLVPEQAALLRRAALANAVLALMALALLLARVLG